MRVLVLYVGAMISLLGLTQLIPPFASAASARSSRSASSRASSGIIVREARRPPARWRAEVLGDFQTSTEAARLDALSKAAHELTAFLSDQYPSLRFRPSPEFLASQQMVDNPPFEEAVVEQFQDAPTLYRQKVTVELRDEHLRRIFEEDRRERSHDRLLVAARFLGAIMIGLGVLVAYLRLDDWTKGYFSTILILTSLVLSVVGLAVWWWWF